MPKVTEVQPAVNVMGTFQGVQIVQVGMTLRFRWDVVAGHDFAGVHMIESGNPTPYQVAASLINNSSQYEATSPEFTAGANITPTLIASDYDFRVEPDWLA